MAQCQFFDNYDRFRVKPYWDTDNTPVEVYEATNVRESILNSLQRIDPRYYLSDDFISVGSRTLPCILHNRNDLRNQGFRLLYTPIKRFTCQLCGYVPIRNLPIVLHERCKEVGDRMIVQSMTRDVVTDPSLENICLVSGNSDFSLPLRFLREGGYRVFLMVNQQARATYVVEGGDYIFSWEDVIANGGADPAYGPRGRWGD